MTPAPALNFGEAIQSVFRKYAEFTGRASRSEFWWFTLFSTLVFFGTSSIFAGLSGAWFFAVIVPSLAVGVRRLRDAGLSWAWLFFLLLPIVGLIVLAVLFAQPPQATPRVVTDVPPGRVPPTASA